ncbi:MAG: hypothetical protein QG663_1314, partial [Thermodesulfobacteriota bacterium]|nr:hypothetical protein [Thermodesulfobacteriota bacterium]
MKCKLYFVAVIFDRLVPASKSWFIFYNMDYGIFEFFCSSNPVFYLLYAYVRTGAVLEKAKKIPVFQNLCQHLDCFFKFF